MAPAPTTAVTERHYLGTLFALAWPIVLTRATQAVVGF
jgi:hypothetical protein